MTRILLVDDHEIFRDGLKSLINDLADFEVVAEAGNGIDALRILRAISVDLIITDLHMPEMNGIQLVKQTREEFPKAKILLLTMDADKSFIKTISELGAHGYVTKASGIDQLKSSLSHVVSPSEEFQITVSEKERSLLTARNVNKQKCDGLTKREREILALIAEGLTDKSIASKLHLSPYTVITHRKSLLSKLGMSNKVELARFAIEVGISRKA